MQVRLHEDVPILQGLFKDAASRGLNTTYSKRGYQNAHDNSETCGRHVAVRLLNSDMTDAQYSRYIDSEARRMNGASPDEVVVRLTYPLIQK
jgi:hypothetical protein